MARRRAGPRAVPPDRDIEDTALVLGVLASPGKLKILYALATAERSVGDLVPVAGEGRTQVSRHLAALRAVSLVEYRRDGNFVHYRLTDVGVAAVSMAEAVRECRARSTDGPA